jgi:L-iditol 2-dehydrogenase
MAQFDTNIVHYKEVTIFGANAFAPRHFDRALELVISGRIDSKRFITHEYALEELDVAFKNMQQGKMIKGIVRYY